MPYVEVIDELLIRKSLSFKNPKMWRILLKFRIMNDANPKMQLALCILIQVNMNDGVCIGKTLEF